MATYVLIPGAGGDAWYWHQLVPELRERGHEAVAVDLPADTPRTHHRAQFRSEEPREWHAFRLQERTQEPEGCESPGPRTDCWVPADGDKGARSFFWRGVA
jgi:hypothetical protein